MFFSWGICCEFFFEKSIRRPDYYANDNNHALCWKYNANVIKRTLRQPREAAGFLLGLLRLLHILHDEQATKNNVHNNICLFDFFYHFFLLVCLSKLSWIDVAADEPERFKIPSLILRALQNRHFLKLILRHKFIFAIWFTYNRRYLLVSSFRILHWPNDLSGKHNLRITPRNVAGSSQVQNR